VREIRGDLLDTELKDIAHGCNLRASFGAGVAKAISDRWPEAREEYLNMIVYRESYGFSTLEDLLGNFSQYIDTETGVSVYNIYTQHYFGRDGQKYARYLDVIDGVRHVFEDITSFRHPNPYGLAIPRIGCGLGGLDWGIMKELLLELEEKWEPFELWVYNND
jgi:O-acetyl-ADP-ribose deacetylase (regulator of RNase III)